MIAKLLFKLVVFALVVLAILVSAVFFAQRSFFYPAPKERLDDPPSGYRFVETRTSEGLKLRAAFRPAKKGKAVLVFFHGNGDSIAGADIATRILTDAGYGALLVEYRGYGGNPGSPSEDGFYRDGEAALAWLQENGISSSDLVFIGNSIGSGTATEMALRHKPKALVLVSGFASLPFVVSDLYAFIPAKLLVRDRFDNEAKIGKVKSPILLLHGDADRLVRPVNAQRLSRAAQNARLLMINGKGHELAYLPEGQRPALDWLDSQPWLSTLAEKR